jgi:hypothetical protein
MAVAKVSRVESVYMERRVFDPPKEFVEKAHIKSMEEYKELYKKSIEDPQGFWAEMAEEYLDWFKRWGKAERLIQLLGSPFENLEKKQSRHYLARRAIRRIEDLHLSGASP